MKSPRPHVASNPRRASSSLRWILLCCVALLAAASTHVEGQRADDPDEPRHFDARVLLRSARGIAPLLSPAAQLQTVQAARTGSGGHV